jgi:hypothetical protein
MCFKNAIFEEASSGLCVRRPLGKGTMTLEMPLLFAKDISLKKRRAEWIVIFLKVIEFSSVFGR